MEVKFIEAITNLFAPIFLGLGFSEFQSTALSILATIGLLILGYRLLKSWKTHQSAKDLAPFWEYPDIKDAQQYFIQTQAQNVSPTLEENEPGDSKPFVFKKKLIPFFLKTVFDDTKKSKNKYHLILAGSGMGKTTFMLNLFVAYHSLFRMHRKKHTMRLMPFRDERILGKIQEIGAEEAKNTILLLDAFDEDAHFLKMHHDSELSDNERFRNRLDEVMEAVRDFRRVIITSRTQYFPERQDKDYELRIPRMDGKGFHKLGIMHISPFEESEVQRYLHKKYGRFRPWNWKQKRKAEQIIDRSPNLMVRPMLLNYIDLLVNSNQEFHNTYEIYETMVEKWLDREKNRQPEARQSKFKEDLLQFSRLVALELYHKGTTKLDKSAAVAIAPQHELQLKNYEMTGKSLLTRDGAGNWKFAHKSILEYFIAKEALEDLCFGIDVNWTGWDIALSFYREMDGFEIEMIFVRDGSFTMGSDEDDREKPAHIVNVPSFSIGKYPITQKQWISILGTNPSLFKRSNLPVGTVSWVDIKVFLKKLNEVTNKSFRLPSEAEWELAAIESVFGAEIFNMGGIYMWCEDDWHKNYEGAPTNGSAWLDSPRGAKRVLRGGSLLAANEDYRRLTYRFGKSLSERGIHFGFRVVLPSTANTKKVAT